jgi:hypothetical protein
MNLLTIILMLGVLAVGFIAGMIVEMSIDAQTIRELRQHNHKLKLENMQLCARPETIEIVDNSVGKGIDFSQKW